MAQDYAKGTSSKGRQKKNLIATHKSKLVFLCLLLCAFMLYHYSSIDIEQIQKGVYTKIQSNQTRPKALPRPKFEFYTRLPQSNGAFNTEKKSAPQTPPIKAKASIKKGTIPVIDAKPIALNTHHYLIQVASFKKRSDADNLRANLIMQGHTVSLSHFKNSQTTWYRVQLGPFSSLQQAKQKQLALERAHYNGLIKKIG